MSEVEKSSRRSFIKQATVAGASAIAIPSALSAFPSPANSEGNGFTFLFQGDSITDGNRSRNTDWNHVLGHGYAYLIAARLWYQLPKKGFHFFNRGISGNTVPDLAARWTDDTIAINPNVLSILIGVNDTMHAVGGDKNFTVESYENDYRALLTQTKERLPQVELVICEPFILPVRRIKDKWADYQQEVTSRQQVAKKLATEFNAVFVPLQDSFNQAAAKYPPVEYWMWDGIHPMPNGHELFAREWIKHAGKKLHFIR
jgi:lysophospholipase L1-like esterase